MIVVSDSSPLISLARIARLDVLGELFQSVHVPAEVIQEVVVHGAGRPAAETVSEASWIHIHRPVNTNDLIKLRSAHPLGIGELATILLARSLPADLALIDDRSARRLARANGLAIMGCVGVLEIAYRKGLVADLRKSYAELLGQGIRIDAEILNSSLSANGLLPL